MTFQEIRSSTSVRDLLTRYGVKLRGNRCQCFVHNGKDFNMSVYKDRVVHCFVCGVNLDCFKIVQHFENCDFKEALIILGGDKVLSSAMRLRARKDIIKQTQLEVVEKQYDNALRRYCACDYMISYYDQTRDERYYKYYVFAMQNKSYYEHILDETEAKLFELRNTK